MATHLSIALPAAIAKVHGADPDCEDLAGSRNLDVTVAGALGKNHSLYLVPCWSGAYNVFFRVYLFDKRYANEAKPELFVAYGDQTGWFGSSHLVNATFDAATKAPTAFEKYGGPGDCGGWVAYQCTGSGLRMMIYRQWGKCNGNRVPKEWPVIFKYEKLNNN